jgi:hypothetical protein
MLKTLALAAALALTGSAEAQTTARQSSENPGVSGLSRAVWTSVWTRLSEWNPIHTITQCYYYFKLLKRPVATQSLTFFFPLSGTLRG